MDNQIQPDLVTEFNEELFQQELSPIAASFLEKYADAQNINVSYTTIWRWSNKTTKKLPDPNKVLQVLKMDSGINRVDLIANFYGGQIARFLAISFPNSFIIGKDLVENDDFIRDKFDFYLYYICGTERGSSETELKQTFGVLAARESKLPEDMITAELVASLGSSVLPRLKRFVDRGLVAIDDNGFYKRTNDKFDLNTEKIQRLSLEISKDFANPAEFSSGVGAYYATQQSVSAKVAEELTVITKNYVMQCYKLMKEGASTSPDSIPFTISALAAKLNTEIPSEGEVLQ
jgi:hypothetical protein